MTYQFHVRRSSLSMGTNPNQSILYEPVNVLGIIFVLSRCSQFFPQVNRVLIHEEMPFEVDIFRFSNFLMFESTATWF